MKAGGDVRPVVPPVPCTKCNCHSKSKEEELGKETSEKKQPKRYCALQLHVPHAVCCE